MATEITIDPALTPSLRRDIVDLCVPPSLQGHGVGRRLHAGAILCAQGFVLPPTLS